MTVFPFSSTSALWLSDRGLEHLIQGDSGLYMIRGLWALIAFSILAGAPWIEAWLF